MKALIPRNCTIEPLTTPAMIAVPMAMTKAPPSPIAFAEPTKTAADSAATEATERSKFPEIRTTVIATAMKPISEDWYSTFVTLRTLR